MNKKRRPNDRHKDTMERRPASNNLNSRAEKAGTLVATTGSEEETFELAKSLARQFRGNEVVLLSGELGAGKTIFAKGVAAGLGLKDHNQVCSPSFTIMNIYQGRFLIFHFDLYRLEKSSDILDLGWEDCLDRGVVMVEWGERVPFDLEAIRVKIRKGRGDERTIEISWPPG
jgi:tRNA threonylcarbamoyladenosine biosynthesis protein TsaE